MTAIEWTDQTWNPTLGCTRVSPGCDGCYAIPQAWMRSHNPNPKIAQAFAGTAAKTDDGLDWTGRINLLDQRLDQPKRWREPTRVFVNSMSDVFAARVPVDFVTKIWRTMADTPRHTYQVLTKRPERVARVLDKVHAELGLTEPLPNVWLGTSVENQKYANLRIPHLLQAPAAVRFLSVEPLLGPVDLWGPIVPGRGRPKLTYWLDGRPGWGPDQTDDRGRVFQELALGPRIDWVIVGGESGPGARPMHPQWVRTLRDQCVHSGIAFFFKQWGEWGPAPFTVRVCDPDTGWQGTDEELAAAKADSETRGATHVHTGNWYEQDGERQYHLHEIGHKPWSLERVALPEGTAAIRRWGKKRAGRELDGRTWDQYPAAAS